MVCIRPKRSRKVVYSAYAFPNQGLVQLQHSSRERRDDFKFQPAANTPPVSEHRNLQRRSDLSTESRILMVPSLGAAEEALGSCRIICSIHYTSCSHIG